MGDGTDGYPQVPIWSGGESRDQDRCKCNSGDRQSATHR
jgi:hypothetical protein